MIASVLLGVVGVLLVGSLPWWPYSRKWSYLSTGGIGIVLLLVVLLLHWDVF